MTFGKGHAAPLGPRQPHLLRRQAGRADLRGLRRAPPEGGRRPTSPAGPGGGNGGFNAASTVPGYTIAQINNTDPTTGIFAPRIPAYVGYDINNKRLGVSGSLQFKPDADTEITLDALMPICTASGREAQLQAIGLSRAGTGKPQTIIRDGVIENNNLVAARMDNVDLRNPAGL
ncbi:hypothetical protein ACRAWD_18585 [Caulobacter segnis]